MAASHPKFTDLPLNASHPPRSAWGLYGDDDERGTLNLLTPERTKEAAKEIQTGVSIGLNWPLHLMDYAGDFREATKHEIFEIGKNMNVCLPVLFPTVIRHADSRTGRQTDTQHPNRVAMGRPAALGLRRRALLQRPNPSRDTL